MNAYNVVYPTCKASVAQWTRLACWTSNTKVVGSSPTGGGIF